MSYQAYRAVATQSANGTETRYRSHRPEADPEMLLAFSEKLGFHSLPDRCFDGRRPSFDRPSFNSSRLATLYAFPVAIAFPRGLDRSQMDNVLPTFPHPPAIDEDSDLA